MNAQERAYAMLQERQTITAISIALDVSRKQVMEWLCAECLARHRPGASVSHVDEYENQLGRQIERLKPE